LLTLDARVASLPTFYLVDRYRGIYYNSSVFAVVLCSTIELLVDGASFCFSSLPTSFKPLADWGRFEMSWLEFFKEPL
jgi:hypothetical protein